MNRSLIPVCMLLFCLGCERSSFAPEPLPVARIGQRAVVNGFDNALSEYVDTQGLRLAAYFDFTPYDSLNISFTAARFTAGQEAVPFRVKVGPGYYATGSLSGQFQSFSFSVPVRALAKPRSAALSFYADDPVSPLVLSNLSVIGWYSD